MRPVKMMRVPLFLPLLLGAFLASCAALAPVPELAFCDNQKVFRRGVVEGENGQNANGDFLKACAEESQAPLSKRYRNGFELGRARAKAKKAAALPVAKKSAELEEAPTWICEVEASAKVFTGVGQSELGALKAARENCGAHFQAKECSEYSECRQSTL